MLNVESMDGSAKGWVNSDVTYAAWIRCNSNPSFYSLTDCQKSKALTFTVYIPILNRSQKTNSNKLEHDLHVY